MLFCRDAQEMSKLSRLSSERVGEQITFRQTVPLKVYF